MILQGKTPQALTITGLLGVAGIGLLLLPLVPGWAQTPSDEKPAQQDKKKVERKPEEADDAARAEQLKRAQGDVKRMQEELDKFRQDLAKRQHEMQKEMQQRTQELHKAIQRMRQAQGSFQGRPPFGPGDDKNPMPGRPPGPPGDARPPWAQGGNVEQHLNEVERKLEMLLKDVRDLRQHMRQSPKGPGPGQPPRGPGQPKDDNNPRPPAGGPNQRPRETGADR